MRASITYLLAAAIIPTSLNASLWIEKKAEGWAWYEDKETQKEDTKESPKVINKLFTSKEILNFAKEELEESLAKSILDPTTENVEEYQRLQKKWMQNTSNFARSWVLNLINHPELDERITSPTTQYGINVSRKEEEIVKRNLIKNLSQEFSLLYFYKGEEQGSQAFSLVVREFATRHKWRLLGITLDGTHIAGVNTVEDPNADKTFGVKIFPSLYMLGKENHEAIPIAYGYSSLDQIEEAMVTLFHPQTQGEEN